MKLKMTQRARAHKIGVAHIEYVISRHEAAEGIRPSGETELTWIGVDDRGLELHIIAVPTEKWLLIIHAAPREYGRK
jgi:hypothetical protein